MRLVLAALALLAFGCSSGGSSSGGGTPPGTLPECPEPTEAPWLSWDTPKPVGASYADAWRSPSGTTWAVAGDHVVRRDSSGSTVQRLSGNADGIWGVSDTQIWAVGYDGVFFYDGVEWTRQYSEVGKLKAIHGSGSNDIWAVGLDGNAAHYDGTQWKPATVPTPVSSPSGSFLRDVFALTPTKAYIASGSGGLEWDGAKWFPINDVPFSSAVWASSESNVWFVSETTAYRFDGSSWTKEELSNKTDELNAVWTTGADDVWIGSEAGKYRHWQGTQWDEFSSFEKRDVFAFAGDASELLSFGEHGLVERFDGTVWNTETQPMPVSALGRSGNTLWAAGEAVYKKSEGGAWQKVQDQGFESLWVISDTDVWGAGKTVSHFDGQSWTDVLSGEPYYDVWASGAKDVWVVSRKGKVLRYDGTAFAEVAQVNAKFGASIRGTSASDVWVGGTEQLMHWDGAAWADKSDLTIRDLEIAEGAVWGVGHSKGWHYLRLSGGEVEVIAACKNSTFGPSSIAFLSGTLYAGMPGVNDPDLLYRIAPNDVQAVATHRAIAHSDMLVTPSGQLLIANQIGLLGYTP